MSETRHTTDKISQEHPVKVYMQQAAKLIKAVTYKKRGTPPEIVLREKVVVRRSSNPIEYDEGKHTVYIDYSNEWLNCQSEYGFIGELNNELTKRTEVKTKDGRTVDYMAMHIDFNNKKAVLTRSDKWMGHNNNNPAPADNNDNEGTRPLFGNDVREPDLQKIPPISMGSQGKQPGPDPQGGPTEGTQGELEPLPERKVADPFKELDLLESEAVRFKISRWGFLEFLKARCGLLAPNFENVRKMSADEVAAVQFVHTLGGEKVGKLMESWRKRCGDRLQEFKTIIDTVRAQLQTMGTQPSVDPPEDLGPLCRLFGLQPTESNTWGRPLWLACVKAYWAKRESVDPEGVVTHWLFGRTDVVYHTADEIVDGTVGVATDEHESCPQALLRPTGVGNCGGFSYVAYGIGGDKYLLVLQGPRNDRYKELPGGHSYYIMEKGDGTIASNAGVGFLRVGSDVLATPVKWNGTVWVPQGDKVEVSSLLGWEGAQVGVNCCHIYMDDAIRRMPRLRVVDNGVSQLRLGDFGRSPGL